MRAAHVIRGEHRTLTAVVHGMLLLLRHVKYGIAQPNFELLGAMLNYIQAYLGGFHHPKEEAYLFRPLRERHPDIAPLLDRLQEEHRTGGAMLVSMQDALARYRRDGAPALPTFYATIAAYAVFHYAHVRAEEDSILSAAEQYLTATDWQRVDEAFAGHADPLLGADAGSQYEEIFRRIVHLAPAPLGAAEEESPGTPGATPAI
jgi:hemerythrin-like domain-containing protein